MRVLLILLIYSSSVCAMNDAVVLAWTRTYQPFVRAIKEGQTEKVKEFLANGAKGDYTFGLTGESLLHVATRHEKEKVIAQLLLHGADISYRVQGLPVMFIAAQKGGLPTIKALLCSAHDRAKPFVSKQENVAQELKDAHRSMFTFLCVLKRKGKELAKVPQDIRKIIYRLLLPAPEKAVHALPCNHLASLPFFDKKLYLDALVQKHIQCITAAITETNGSGNTPQKVALSKGYNEVAELLDPEKIDNYEPEIRANYKALME